MVINERLSPNEDCNRLLIEFNPIGNEDCTYKSINWNESIFVDISKLCSGTVMVASQ
jgi:hypothetical protein